jgi:hypothetical protein
MGFLNTFQAMPLAGLEGQQIPLNLSIPQSSRSEADVPPWNPNHLKQGDSNQFVMEEFVQPSPRSAHSPGSSSAKSTSTKKESEDKSPSPIRRVKDGKVEKRKAEQSGKFVIMTPTSINNALSGQPNPFECFEASRASQRGRKGPLANETKENALQVRRLGACFCCHARKVKCDKERPCKSCKKLMIQVPQVVCWQFQDFIPVLFPDFIRAHLKKEKVARFLTDNIDGFAVNGVEKPCTVDLFSGARFSAVLSLPAKFFTAKTAEVMQHYHMQVGRSQIDLQPQDSAPIALDVDSVRRDELKKKAKEYVQAIVDEPFYAEQVTDSFRHTDLPRKVLKIVQDYSKRTDSPIVKKALSIYAMHYVMTRHLCLTPQTIANLGPTKLVPQNMRWVTPRVLNRQIKAIVDDLMLREMQVLFENFSKLLKPKSRHEWAPSLAAFLVLCLFMESVEIAADNFVISQNEINMREGVQPRYRRAFALNVNQEVENMPFKQFAFQFHQIYLTHTRDATSKAFNPLVDDLFLDVNELDAPALEMVLELRKLIHGESWDELDFLTMDPMLPNDEDHPYPRDTSFNYTGRLVAKFLLSFTSEKYIFEPQL